MASDKTPVSSGAVTTEGVIFSVQNGIAIRLMHESDINERYLSWFKDAEVTHYLDSKNLSFDDALTYYRSGKETGKRFQFAVCDASSGLHIGSVKLGDIDFKSRISDLVTVIGEKNYWGKGVATLAIRMASQLAFDNFNIRKLSGGIASSNIGSVKAYTAAGWVIEAILHSHHLLQNGQINDRIIVSCFNPLEMSDIPKFPLPINLPVPSFQTGRSTGAIEGAFPPRSRFAGASSLPNSFFFS